MEKKSNSSIDEYNFDNDAFNELRDVCCNDDVLHIHLDDDDHEFYERDHVDDDDDDVDDDVDDDNNQHYQNKKRKLSDEGKQIQIDKLNGMKLDAKFECKERLDEIQELKLQIEKMEPMVQCLQEKIRNYNVQIDELHK